MAKATESVNDLDEITDAGRLNKPEPANILTLSMKMHKQHLNCLTGKPVNTGWLDDAFGSAQYKIRRLGIAKIPAMTALRDGDQAAAKKRLSYLRKNGEKTNFRKWADRLN